MEKQKKSRKPLLVGVIAAVVVLAALLALLLTQCVGGQGPADSTGQTETTASAAGYELYWNVDRLDYKVNSGEDVGSTGREPHEDGYYHVIFAKDGELLELRVIDRRLVNRIDGQDIMGLVFDENGIVVDLIRLDDMPLEKLAWSFYVQSIASTAVKFNSSYTYDGIEQTIRINADTKILDVSGWSEYIGAPATLQKGDRAYVVANEDGVVTHIFVYERDGILHTEVRFCEHCQEEVEWTSWLKKGELPIDKGHYFLENDVTLVTQMPIREAQEICLDLNGKTVTGTTSQRLYSTFGVDSRLAVFDTSEEKTGAMKTMGKNMDEGGVLWCRYGSIDVYGGTFESVESYTKLGGNVFAVSKNGTFTMHGGLVTGGTSKRPGGNVQVKGKFIMNGGTITKGTTENANGGNIAIDDPDASFEFNGGTISNGTARKGKGNTNGVGGNMYSSGTVTMSGGTITGGTVLDENGKRKNDDWSHNVFLVNGTFNMYGGRINGYFDTRDTSATDAKTATVYLSGWANIHGAAEGHKNLNLRERVKLIVGRLSNSAKIGVSAVNTYFSEKTLESNAQYFFSDFKGAGIVWHDQRLAVGRLTCMCFAEEGEEHDASVCDGTKQLWAAWNGTTAISKSGNFYLPDDVTRPTTQAVIGTRNSKDANGNTITYDPIVVNIDFNGKTAQYPNTRGMLIFENATVSLFNSQEGGSFAGKGWSDDGNNNAATILTFPGSTLNIYDGVTLAAIKQDRLSNSGVLNVRGTVNMYGGEIIGTEVIGHGGAVGLTGTAVFNMYNDAKITGGYTTSSGSNGGAINMATGSVFNMTDNAVVSGGQARNCGGNFYINGTLNMSGNAKITGGTQRGENGEAILENSGNIFCVNGVVNMSGNSSVDGYFTVTGVSESGTSELHVSENAKVTGAAEGYSNVTLRSLRGGQGLLILDAPLGDDACISVTNSNSKVISRPEGMSDEAWAAFESSASSIVSDNGLLKGVWEEDGIYLRGAETIHCICGANEGETHIGGCDGTMLIWESWAETNALPTAAGNYYLTSDVTIGQWGFYDDPNAGTVVNLDLNGHTVTSTKGDRAIFVHNNFTDDFTLNLTDSSVDHKGTITRSGSRATDGALIWMRGLVNNVNVTMNIYHITLDASGITNTGKGAAVTVDNKHTLNMYDVTLKGGTASNNNGGALYISGNGAVNAVDCTISAVGADKGGVIYMQDTASLTLTDSTITGGKADSGKGGGVYITSASTLQIGGSAKITGNTGNDLYLESGATITIADDWAGNGEDAMVVEMANGIGKFAVAGDGLTLTQEYTAYFSNDNGINLSNNKLYVGVPEEDEAVDPSSHCLCGANEGESHIGGCDGTVLTWKPWTDAQYLPTAAGNYYLVGDVTTGQWGFYDNPNAGTVVNLDLNGHTVTSTKGDRAIFVHNNFTDDFTLNITDSSADHKGTIVRSGSSATNGALIWMRGLVNDVDVAMNIYRITLDASGITNTGKGAAVTVDNKHTLNMYNATLKGGKADGNNGGALYISGNGAVNAVDCTISAVGAVNGGAIYMQDTANLTLTGSTVDGAAATNGGAVYMAGGTLKLTDSTLGGATVTTNGGAVYMASGELTMTDSTVNGAPATLGGAIYLGGSTASVTMEGGLIKGANVTTGGCAVNIADAGGSFTMKSSTKGEPIIDASGCTTVQYAGAVHVSGNSRNASSFTMDSGKIIGCESNARFGGGSVFIQGANAAFTMNGGTITGAKITNASRGGGGNVHVAASGKFYMNGGTITGGETDNGLGGGVYVASGTTFQIGGDAKIAGNKDNDLYLTSGATITIAGDWAGNGENAMVVSMADGTGKFAVAGDGLTLTEEYAAYFSNDNGIDLGNNELYVGDAPVTDPDEGDGDGEAADLSSHCLCGANVGEDHIGGCDGTPLTWEPWTETNALPTTAGNYYLVSDVTLPSATCWLFNNNTASGEFNLDLNGKNITAASNERGIVLNNNLAANVTVNITDSSAGHKGTIIRSNSNTTNQGALIWMRGLGDGVKGFLNIYRITLDASGIGTTLYGAGVAVEKNQSLNMYSATLKGGSTQANGGALYISGNGAVNAVDCTIDAKGAANGSAIYMQDTASLTLTDTTVNGAAATSEGGAIYMANGTLNMTDSTINGASAKLGGAMAIYGGTVTMKGGKIVAGDVTTASGAIQMKGVNSSVSFTMDKSEKGEPEIDATGKNGGRFGAVANVDGSTASTTTTFTMNCGTLKGGTVTTVGGGAVLVQGSKANFIMNGGTITGGKADSGKGGGVYLTSATFLIGGDAKITGNTGNDLYLDTNATITIADGWVGDAENAMVVSMAAGTGTFATAAEGVTLTNDHIPYFSSADGHEILVGTDGLYMKETDPSSHCLCGANSGEEHIGCDGTILTWEPWDSTTSLPSSAGNYYLTGDVASDQWGFFNATYAGTVLNLDLNGHSITYTTGHRAIFINKDFTQNFTLNITDSSGSHKGTITTSGSSSAEGAMIWMRPLDNAVNVYLNIYRITLDASQMTSTNYRACVAVEKNHTLNMYGVTLKGGTATGNNGGALYISGNGAVNAVDCTIGAVKAVNGGAIYMQDTASLTLTDTTVNGAAVTTEGGAIYMANGTLNMTDSTINGASAKLGGAMAIYGGTVTMKGGKIVAGNVTSAGGAIQLKGVNSSVSFTMDKSEKGEPEIDVSGKNGGRFGAVANVDGSTASTTTTFTMNCGTMKGGTVTTVGGGAVLVQGSKANFIMNGGTITGGKADSGKGGGVYVTSGPTFQIGGSAKITGNTGNDLYLESGATITIADGWVGDAENAMVVSMAAGTGTIATAAEGVTLTEEQKAYFAGNVTLTENTFVLN